MLVPTEPSGNTPALWVWLNLLNDVLHVLTMAVMDAPAALIPSIKIVG